MSSIGETENMVGGSGSLNGLALVNLSNKIVLE